MAASPIPVRNLYYLLCYSWNRLAQGELVDVSTAGSTELADLFAVVLIGGVEHLARRGLEQGYESRSEELPTVRGKLNLLHSVRRLLLQHGKASCEFDEITVNTLSNRILKTTLRVLSATEGIDHDLCLRLKQLHKSLRGIEELKLSPQHFRLVQLHSNNGFYRFLLNVCELVHVAALPDQGSGTFRFRDFVRDERKMARVFQDFVYNFFRLERPDLRVKREKIKWKASSESDPRLSLLPSMETDISIRKGLRRIIIDTKYYSQTLSKYYDAEKVHSANLYQLMTYLRSTELADDEILEGMLLYPTVDRSISSKYVIEGFPVTIATVDLNREWSLIRDDLRALVMPLAVNCGRVA